MSTKKLALSGILLAIVIALSWLEQSLPPLPLVPPQTRIGLANAAVLVCVISVGYAEAVILSVLKSVFVFVTRGPVAFALSLSGSLMAVAVSIALVIIFKRRLSVITISVFSALAHSLGQCFAYSIITKTLGVFFYMGILGIASVITGIATGYIAKGVTAINDRNHAFKR